MTAQLAEELIKLKEESVPNHIDSRNLLQLIKKYKRILEIGISYQELISLYEMDTEIFLQKIKIIFMRSTPKNSDYHEISRNELEMDYQTEIENFVDKRDILLAINIANGIVNEETKEREAKSLKMFNESK